MRRHGITTARYQNFSNLALVQDYIRTVDHRIVIKASGLAAGKGFILPSTYEALQALEDILFHRRFGDAGHPSLWRSFSRGRRSVCLRSAMGGVRGVFRLGRIVSVRMMGIRG
jgi:phosphoribosylamine--glycine ligase/phosphoribosylformylglycinamidine cyclo-ligase